MEFFLQTSQSTTVPKAVAPSRRGERGSKRSVEVTAGYMCVRACVREKEKEKGDDHKQVGEAGKG